jgi:hypothetical protein
MQKRQRQKGHVKSNFSAAWGGGRGFQTGIETPAIENCKKTFRIGNCTACLNSYCSLRKTMSYKAQERITDLMQGWGSST